MRDYLLAVQNDPGAAVPPSPFDGRGNPVKQFYRVIEDTIDSNFDGSLDDEQLSGEEDGDPYDPDVDGDGIPNGYDSHPFDSLTANGTVLINEVLAANDFDSIDGEGNSSDWIELYNPTLAEEDLSGWHLSDDPADPTRWTFPAGATIAPGGFLVVWAAGGPSKEIAGEFYTNFALKPDPETIQLSAPGGTKVDTYDPSPPNATPNYGPQRVDISFGRFPSASGLKFGYMPVTTRGAHNIGGYDGFADPPSFDSTSPGLYESTTLTVELSDGDPGARIYYTTNTASPTPYSMLYGYPLEIDRTTIVRAMAWKPGFLPSPSVTRSFLFKEDILGTAPQGTAPTDQQGARDVNGDFAGLLRGYPEATEDPSYAQVPGSSAEDFPMHYEMHPDVIRDHKDAISAGLDAVPVISIVSTVDRLFDAATGGLYPNTGKTDDSWYDEEPDPQDRRWQRLCSFEFIEADQSDFVQDNACLLATGATSIYQQVTRKHNMRVKFDTSHGPEKLEYQLWEDSSVDTFTDFNLKNPLQDCWGQTYFPTNNEATYCDEGWVRSAHREMGHEGPRRRWVHLFLNGIYWGPYELTGRVDEDFLNAHYGTDTVYDVLKQGGNQNWVEAVSGDTDAYDQLVLEAIDLKNAVELGEPPSVLDDHYDEVLALLDVENYIDYLLCQSFADTRWDWPENNYRLARDRNDGKFRFFVWDAEWAFEGWRYQIASPVDLLDNVNGITRLHFYLKSYQGYRNTFSDRIKKHFFVVPGDPESGALAIEGGIDRAVALYQAEMDGFEPLIYCESARWGALAKEPPYTKSDPGNQSPFGGDWDTATGHMVNTWLPLRRAAFLDAFQSVDPPLYQP